jgi:subtilisin-like proprotein convertase family protein
MRKWTIRHGAALVAALALLVTSVVTQPVALGATVSGSYSSGNLSTTIPDLSTANSTITVPDTGTVSGVTVKLRLNHPSDRDLNLDLVGPDGTTATLAVANAVEGSDFGSGANGCSGSSFAVFDDNASTPIFAGVAPFVGSYSPVDLLAIFAGHASNGTWTLRVSDEVSQDVGTLYCWQLDVTRDTAGSPNPNPTTPICSPRPAVAMSTSATGDGRLRVTISATGANNRLQSVRLGTLRNARVDVAGGSSGLTSGATASLNGASSALLLVSRVGAGGVTVPMTITDGCGDWTTFVGGGSTSF